LFDLFLHLVEFPEDLTKLAVFLLPPFGAEYADEGSYHSSYLLYAAGHDYPKELDHLSSSDGGIQNNQP